MKPNIFGVVVAATLADAWPAGAVFAAPALDDFDVLSPHATSESVNATMPATWRTTCGELYIRRTLRLCRKEITPVSVCFATVSTTSAIATTRAISRASTISTTATFAWDVVSDNKPETLTRIDTAFAAHSYSWHP